MEEKLYTHWKHYPNIPVDSLCYNLREKHESVCVISVFLPLIMLSRCMQSQGEIIISLQHATFLSLFFFFSLSKFCHASFLKVSRGRYCQGFIADIRDENQKPLKFRVSSLNTGAGRDDPVVFQSSLWALTRAWPSAGSAETNVHF